MDVLQAIGSRRSIRWFKPWEPVAPAAIQRLLEAARMTGSPGNLQPWRAIVVVAADLDPADRRTLLEANNRQRAHELAPVWIYWYADPDAAVPEAFMRRVEELFPLGVIPAAFGWSPEAARRAIVDGEPAAQGLPALDTFVHGLPYELSAVIAAQETNAACAVATLAAVGAGLATCLHTIASPARQEEVKAVLGAPERLVPVWVQLLGHAAESADAGGQRPREPFEQLFSLGRWGSPFARDPDVVEEMHERGLLQDAAPRPGREEELAHLARMFGFSS
jgi:nitroreductase